MSSVPTETVCRKYRVFLDSLFTRASAVNNTLWAETTAVVGAVPYRHNWLLVFLLLAILLLANLPLVIVVL